MLFTHKMYLQKIKESSSAEQNDNEWLEITLLLL